MSDRCTVHCECKPRWERALADALVERALARSQLAVAVGVLEQTTR